MALYFACSKARPVADQQRIKFPKCGQKTSAARKQCCCQKPLAQTGHEFELLVLAKLLTTGAKTIVILQELKLQKIQLIYMLR